MAAAVKPRLRISWAVERRFLGPGGATSDDDDDDDDRWTRWPPPSGLSTTSEI